MLAEPGGAGYEAGLGAVCDLELGKDGGDVVAYGLLAEEEDRGNLGVCLSLGEQFEDLELTIGELRECGTGVDRGWSREKPLQPFGDLGAEDRLAVCDGPLTKGASFN